MGGPFQKSLYGKEWNRIERGKNQAWMQSQIQSGLIHKGGFCTTVLPVPHWDRPSELAFCIPHINQPLAGGYGGQLTPARNLPSSEDNFPESLEKGGSFEYSAAKTQRPEDGCASLVMGIWAGHRCTKHRVNKHLLFIVSPAVGRSSSQKHSLPVSRKGAQINPLIHVIFPPRPSHKAGLTRRCTFLFPITVYFQIQLKSKLTLILHTIILGRRSISRATGNCDTSSRTKILNLVQVLPWTQLPSILWVTDWKPAHSLAYFLFSLPKVPLSSP